MTKTAMTTTTTTTTRRTILFRKALISRLFIHLRVEPINAWGNFFPPGARLVRCCIWRIWIVGIPIIYLRSVPFQLLFIALCERAECGSLALTMLPAWVTALLQQVGAKCALVILKTRIRALYFPLQCLLGAAPSCARERLWVAWQYQLTLRDDKNLVSFCAISIREWGSWIKCRASSCNWQRT